MNFAPAWSGDLGAGPHGPLPPPANSSDLGRTEAPEIGQA